MSDFLIGWQLSRKRFDDEILGLNQAQLTWRLYPQGLSIGEMALHLAGVELSFTSQLAGMELGEDQVRLKRCATEGVVNDLPFPYSADEITPEFVRSSLAATAALVEPMISSPASEMRLKELVSALGPVITGEGAFARLAFHPAYHHGQAYQMKMHPEFPG